MDSSHFRWNMFNQEKKPEKLAPQAEEKRDGEKDEEEGEVEVFAQPPEDKAPRGWLCDLINIFGEEGEFRALRLSLLLWWQHRSGGRLGGCACVSNLYKWRCTCWCTPFVCPTQTVCPLH